jgi:nucleoside-diphosphate-sugar epimerase
MSVNKPCHLVTGATGFLGFNLVKSLLESGHTVYAIKRKYSDLHRYHTEKCQPIWICLEEVNFDQFFLKNKIDTVIHCATDYGRKNSNPINVIEANLIMPLRIIHSALGKVKVFINTDTLLPKDVNSYSLSKHQFKQWLRTYSDRLTCINVALEHFYGPGDDLTKFTSSIINQMLSEVPMIELTGGQQKRDFIFIDDAVSALVTIIQKAMSFDADFFEYEVGLGRSVSIKEFVLLARELCGNSKSELKFGSLPYRENEKFEVVANIKSLNALGWFPEFTLRQGLYKTIAIELSKKSHC